MTQQNVVLEIKNIKNISQCLLELALDKGVYSLVGTNGCGKSTIMNILSLLVMPTSIRTLDKDAYTDESIVRININGIEDIQSPERGMWTTREKRYGKSYMKNNYKGFYEGSIFYGTRFNDYQIMEELKNKIIPDEHLRQADEFVCEHMSYILHGDIEHYKNLYKIKNKSTANGFGFKGIPYFFKSGNKLISQYKMSSGECMLISLIDFVNNLTNLNKYGRKGSKILFFIDEVELALHPSAIDRLLFFFNEHISKSAYEMVVYFSTHSSEVIQKLHPRNIYLLENINGTIECTNPCYANYAIRNLYVPNGFDYLILVEDELAKILADKVIRDNDFCNSKLICILPGGGWSQLLKLHRDIVTYNVLGVGKKLVSIYDGDVIKDVNSKAEYQHLPKAFLPIGSIEKYLLKKLVTCEDRPFIKRIGDKYFTQRSITEIVKEYKLLQRPDQNGKRLYQLLLENLKLNRLDEEKFIQLLCEDIISCETIAIANFTESLRRVLS